MISFLIFANSCKKDIVEIIEPENEFIDENNFTKLRQGAVIVSASEKITSINDNQIIIESNSDNLQNLSVGQIIVSGKSENTPNGFARKITSISKNGNTITFGTTQVGIEEVYEELAVDTKLKVDYENFVSINTTDEKNLKDETSRPIKWEYNSITNTVELRVVLYDHDKDYDTKHDQVIYEGTLQILENNSSFVFNIRPGTNKVFFIKNEMEIKVTNEVKASCALNFDKKEVTIGKIPLTMSLPTSFVVNAYLVLKLGVKGDITGSISITNESNINTLASLSYDETNGWKNLSNVNLTSNTSFDGGIEMNLKAYIKPGLALEFLQYKNVSAGVYLEAYLKFHAEKAGLSSTTEWDFGYGLELKGEAKVALLNTFIDYDYDYIFWEKPYTILAEGTNAPTVTDYDGNTYKTVKIGNQWWMAENLKVTHYADGIEIPNVIDNNDWGYLGYTDKAYCFYNNNANGESDIYGALYTWTAASNGANSDANPSGVQGVCPDGWHLPSGSEWTELVEYLGGTMLAAEKMKEANYTWSINSGTNESGFSALPGGIRTSLGEFDKLGMKSYWWSCAVSYPLYIHLSEYSEYVGYPTYAGSISKDAGAYIRCVKN